MNSLKVFAIALFINLTVGIPVDNIQSEIQKFQQIKQLDQTHQKFSIDHEQSKRFYLKFRSKLEGSRIHKRQIEDFFSQSFQFLLNTLQQEVNKQSPIVAAQVTQLAFNSLFNLQQTNAQTFFNTFLDMLQIKLAESVSGVADANLKYNLNKIINEEIDKLKVQLNTDPNYFKTSLKDLLVTFQTALSPQIKNISELLSSALYQFISKFLLSKVIELG